METLLFLLGEDLKGKPPAKMCTGVHPLESVASQGAVLIQSCVPPSCLFFRLDIQFCLDATHESQCL